jgi:hypothetical protein
VAFWVLLLFLFFIEPGAAKVEKPCGPIFYSHNGGGVELYWFYPGRFASSSVNRETNISHYSCPSTEDRQYAVMVPFDILPPVFIENISLFLYHLDPFPGLAGDPFTPLNLSLRSSLSAEDSARLWEGEISRESYDISNNNQFSRSIGEAIAADYHFWTSLEWRSGYPTAPLVGLSPIFTGKRQYLLSIENPELTPEVLADEYTVGIDFLGWTGVNDINDSCDDAIDFKVLFLDDLDDTGNFQILAESIDSDSLYCLVLPEKNGYLAVAASDDTNSIHSEYIPFMIDSIMPLQVSPLLFDTVISPDEGEQLYPVTLFNKSGKSLSLSFRYDSTALSLDQKMVSLPAGNEIAVNITPLNIDTNSETKYSIVINCPDYYPMIYHLRFRPDKPLDITETANLPAFFSVSELFPNPFNPDVSLKISNPDGRPLRLTIYNLVGQEITAKSLSGRGERIVKWDGVDRYGRDVASGIYFFRVESGNRTIIRKGFLLR